MNRYWRKIGLSAVAAAVLLVAAVVVRARVVFRREGFKVVRRRMDLDQDAAGREVRVDLEVRARVSDRLARSGASLI